MSGEAYLGAHTLVILTADGTRWPVERGSIEPRFDPWTPDAVQPLRGEAAPGRVVIANAS